MIYSMFMCVNDDIVSEGGVPKPADVVSLLTGRWWNANVLWLASFCAWRPADVCLLELLDLLPKTGEAWIRIRRLLLGSELRRSLKEDQILKLFPEVDLYLQQSSVASLTHHLKPKNHLQRSDVSGGTLLTDGHICCVQTVD